MEAAPLGRRGSGLTPPVCVGSARQHGRSSRPRRSSEGDEETERVEAEVDRPANKITVRSCGGWLRILLNTRLVDFSRPLTVEVQTSDGRPNCVFGGIRLRVREEVAARTMAQRGDPTLACTDEVVLRWREVERRWELQCQ